MPKPRRGKGLRATAEWLRGSCPTCERTGVKLLWEAEVNNEKIKVCKKCRDR